MKFSVLVAVVPEEMEDKAVDTAKQAGAGSVTLLQGRGLGLEERKTFFGLTYERSESVLLFVLERRLSVHVLKELHTRLGLAGQDSGFAFTLPLEHLAGIDVAELNRFEETVEKDV